MNFIRRFYPKVRAAASESALAVAVGQLLERLDHQDNLLEGIAEQTTKTNGRVNRLETERDTARAALLWAAGFFGFLLTLGVALLGVLAVK